MKTTLITLAAMAELQVTLTDLNTQVTQIQASLDTVNQDLVDQLEDETALLTAKLDGHVLESYSVAHGIITSAVGLYYDNARNIVSTHILQFEIGGITYFIPASLSATGVPAT